MIIEHRNYNRNRKELLRFVKNSAPGRIIIVIGVSGAGKTTLCHSVLREVYGQPSSWGIGKLPCYEVIALLPEQSYFNSKGLVEESNSQLFMPNLNWLGIENRPLTQSIDSIVEGVTASKKLWESMPRITNRGETQLWNGLCTAGFDRGVKLISIDHASAMCVNHRDKTPAQHVINLMSVGERMRSRHLLTTIQNGYKLWHKHSEIRRRSDIVWVAPYDVSKKEDREPYLKLLKTICAKYRFSPVDLPGILAKEIASATAAICAEMVELMERAFCNAQLEGRVEITKADIQSAYYGNDALATMWADVMEFRYAMANEALENIKKRATEMWP